ncbi:MAG: type II toxin-antitoxin system VapC family toxin [bacterium]
MRLVDVNVLVNASREDAPHHRPCHARVERIVSENEPIGLSDIVLSGFMRIVTHPRVFHPPTTFAEAATFADTILTQPHCHRIVPGSRHWDIFKDLCHKTEAKGTLVMDAYLAALAIESNAEWISLDRDFSRFPGLRWTTP